MQARHLVLFSCLVNSANAQSTHELPNGEMRLHGTINVALANENGVVLVTDSALSNEAGFVKNDQKLFRIDDSSYVAIAGQYSAPGPNIQGSYPAAYLLPSILQKYLDERQGLQYPIERRAITIGRAVAFGLTFLSQFSSGLGQPLQEEPTFITVGGYERGIPKLAQVRLVLGPGVDYSIEVTCTYSANQRIDGRAGQCLAGLSREASIALANPGSDASSELKVFAAAQAKGGGARIPLQTLVSAAGQAAEAAIQAHPGLVGPPLQEVVLRDGKAISFEQPEMRQRTPENFSAIGFSILDHGIFDNSRNSHRVEGITITNTNRAELVMNTSITNCIQQLDRILFVRSTLNDCVLTYAGSTLVEFDPQNILVNTNLLVLGPNVRKDNPFVVSLLAAFPQLRAVSSTEAPYLLWPPNLP